METIKTVLAILEIILSSIIIIFSKRNENYVAMMGWFNVILWVLIWFIGRVK